MRQRRARRRGQRIRGPRFVEHAPAIADQSDFVIASRRRGTDETTDLMRKSGVVVFASLINKIIGKNLTDTSNGYRAFRTEVLSDLTLEQDQYQTAEVIITAAARGWRITRSS